MFNSAKRFLFPDGLRLFHLKDERYHVEDYELSPTLSANVKKHVCNCGKIYSQKSSLDRHQRYECGKPPQYICSICDKGFKQKANFKRHNFTIHRRIFLLDP